MTTTTAERRETALPTARFTWRELVSPSYADRLWLKDADREGFALGSKAMAAAAETASTGGFLLWNRTRDEEGGHLFMLAGQTCEQERQVVDNACWMIGCGAIYAATRVGMQSFMARPDFRFRTDGRHGDTYFAWLLRNDHDVEGMRR